MPVEVRLARPDEYAAAGAVTIEAYAVDGLLEGDSGYATHLGDTATRAQEAELYVAVDPGGAVLGTVTYCPTDSPWRELGKDQDGEFRMLAVSPAARGQGIGRLLAVRCLDRASEDGATRIRISSRPDMRAAHRLYETLGFERAPELDWYPHPGFVLWGFERVIDAALASP